MKWVTDELERLFTESPDDKVIIISSFTSMLDMLQVSLHPTYFVCSHRISKLTFSANSSLSQDHLDSKDIKTCRYQGDMKNDERQHSLKTLKKSKKCKVMLREFLSFFSIVLPSVDADHPSITLHSLPQVWRCRIDPHSRESCHFTR